MNRRTYLLGAAAAASGLTGCSVGPLSPSGKRGPMNDDDLPSDPDPLDGYPPTFDRKPPEREIDPGSFSTIERDGTEVPLVPIDDAYYWYARHGARFADARTWTVYQDSHVFGAVLSPAPGGGSNDPVADWPTDDRVVCYCGCPHHLSSIRAARLIDGGRERVYVIDEGFWEWHDRGYPMLGQEIESVPKLRVIEGYTDPALAGETAWVYHDGSGQREAAEIGGDGRYRLNVRFVDVTPDSLLTVETPAYSVTATLGELASGTVRA